MVVLRSGITDMVLTNRGLSEYSDRSTTLSSNSQLKEPSELYLSIVYA